MATVRIYKVAELLNTSSQEVIALLKRDHGIEVKSASSTIEEVVARQFVDRLARQRNIVVPANASFADTPAAGGQRGRKPGGRPPEPAKPAAPALPPPAPGQERQAGRPGRAAPSSRCRTPRRPSVEAAPVTAAGRRVEPPPARDRAGTVAPSLSRRAAGRGAAAPAVAEAAAARRRRAAVERPGRCAYTAVAVEAASTRSQRRRRRSGRPQRPQPHQPGRRRRRAPAPPPRPVMPRRPAASCRRRCGCASKIRGPARRRPRRRGVRCWCVRRCSRRSRRRRATGNLSRPAGTPPGTPGRRPGGAARPPPRPAAACRRVRPDGRTSPAAVAAGASAGTAAAARHAGLPAAACTHRPGSQRPGGSGRRDQPRMPASVAAPVAPPPVTRTITLAEGMTVADLATSWTSRRRTS